MRGVYQRPNMMREVLRAAVVAAALLGASPEARATAGFPSGVDRYLAMPRQVESIFPADGGCRLCHVRGSAGGDPLTNFGTLLKANGAVKNEDATLGPALDAVQKNQPSFIMDLRAGRDPNLDMMVTTQNRDPVPSYGCGSITGGPLTSWGGELLIVAGLLVFHRRRRARAGVPATLRSDVVR